MGRNLGYPVPAAVLIVAALLIGFGGGWVARPGPKRIAPPAILADALESLEDIERRSGAVAEILDDMAADRISRDPNALRSLRDSMQELTEGVGDVNSQLQVLLGR